MLLIFDVVDDERGSSTRRKRITYETHDDG
jgi:hypothetical protein